MVRTSAASDRRSEDVRIVPIVVAELKFRNVQSGNIASFEMASKAWARPLDGPMAVIESVK